MIAPESTLHLLPWNELLTDIEYLLYLEEERIKANMAYYKSIFYKDNPDNVKLRKLYDRLQEEQQRFDFFTELLIRLQKFNILLLMNAIEDCEAKEKTANGKLPEDWQIIIRKENEKFSVYYYPNK